MWTVPEPDRWAKALGRSHHPVCRVELYSEGVLLTDDAQVVDGEVTDERVTGIRRHLSMSVPPTADWIRWFGLSNLEVRPFRGIRFSGTHIELCPLGRYPLLPPKIDHPRDSAISITADDYWQRVVQDNFFGPTQSYVGRVHDVVAMMIQESIQRTVSNDATGGYYPAPSLVWEKSRQDEITEYLTAISAEAFVDREGNPTVANRHDGPLGPTLQHGLGGTIVEIGTDVVWDDVKNRVGARSSATDVDFGTAIALITDPDHPAHESRIGRRSEAYASPLLMTFDQGLAAARTILSKAAAPSRSLSITCIPDPRRDAGDALSIISPFGQEDAVIQKITHPLTAGGLQNIITTSVAVP